jgi:hypothetical protein
MGKLHFPQDLPELSWFTIPQHCQGLSVKQAQIER